MVEGESLSYATPWLVESTPLRPPLCGTVLCMTSLLAQRRQQLDDDRGDVPGWVLITLMTAGLVILIWALAGPALQGVFQQAIDRVTAF